jgi:hypothetical protein
MKKDINCPLNNKKCHINKVYNAFILNSYPSYMIFNLDNDFFFDNDLYFSLNKVLQIFVLIPNIFNVSNLFVVKNDNNNNYYELIGIIFLKVSKTFSCIFKQDDIFHYFEDNISLKFNNYYDIIEFSLKNGLIPISLFYQQCNIYRKDINNQNERYQLNNNQIIKLEKFVKNTNNLVTNLKNKIKINENIIPIDLNSTRKPEKNKILEKNYFSSSKQKETIKLTYENLSNRYHKINKINNNSLNNCASFSEINLIKDNTKKKLTNNSVRNHTSISGKGQKYSNMNYNLIKYFNISNQNKSLDKKKPHKQNLLIKKKIPINKKSSIKFNIPKKIDKNLIPNNTLSNDKNLNNKNIHSSSFSNINADKKHFNINLKINNNNNYNIYDFGDKKNLINFEEYSICRSDQSSSYNNINLVEQNKTCYENKNWICNNCLTENDRKNYLCLYCNNIRNFDIEKI